MNITKEHIKLTRDINTDEKFTNHSVHVKIKRYFTDVDGNIIDKSLVPAAIQLDYPFYMFGEFDSMGGYKQAQMFCPADPGSFYLCSGVWGVNGFFSNTILGFTGFNGGINAVITFGDIVHVYTDSLSAPSYFIWIVQNSAKTAVGSIMGNSKTTQKDNKFNRLWVEDIRYTTSNNNIDQWNEPIHETRLNNIGLASDDSFSPLIYRTTDLFLNYILKMGLRFYVDQFIGYNTYIRFATEEIQFIFNLKK